MVELRQLKRDRTRAAIIDTATRLFIERGFEATTVADIAAAAEVGQRTLFRYFATKDELLFPDSAARIQAALDAIAARRSSDSPADVLVRALDLAGLTGPKAEDALDPLRLEAIRQIPSAAGYAIRLQREAERQIAAALKDAYPERFDDVTAAAMVGAFVGAFTSASAAVTDVGLGDAARRRAVRAAVAAVLVASPSSQVADDRNHG